MSECLSRPTVDDLTPFQASRNILKRFTVRYVIMNDTRSFRYIWIQLLLIVVWIGVSAYWACDADSLRTSVADALGLGKYVVETQQEHALDAYIGLATLLLIGILPPLAVYPVLHAIGIVAGVIVMRCCGNSVVNTRTYFEQFYGQSIRIKWLRRIVLGFIALMLPLGREAS